MDDLDKIQALLKSENALNTGGMYQDDRELWKVGAGGVIKLLSPTSSEISGLSPLKSPEWLPLIKKYGQR